MAEVGLCHPGTTVCKLGVVTVRVTSAAARSTVVHWQARCSATHAPDKVSGAEAHRRSGAMEGGGFIQVATTFDGEGHRVVANGAQEYSYMFVQERVR
jgi:hypothetical protein